MPYTINETCNGCRLCVSLCPTSAISGKKKKLHHINEDLCIECGVCGLICKPEAVLDTGGSVCKSVKKANWPKPEFNIDACAACTACVNVCPVSVISLSHQKKKNTTVYPYLAEPKKCLSCDFCMEICASDAIRLMAPTATAA